MSIQTSKPPTGPISRRGVSQSVAFVGMIAIYFVAGKVGLSLAFVNASASAVWPPTGIALAALALIGYRVWPAVLIGAFLVNWTTTGAIAVSIAIAFGNTLEALAGAWCFHRYAGGAHAFNRPHGLFRYVLFVAVLSTAISATCGATTLLFGKLAGPQEYGLVWLTWWVGDLVSNLTIAPLLLIWFGRPLPASTRKRPFEAVGLGLLLATVSLLVFGGWLPREEQHYPLEYLVIPALLWAVIRFGQHGVTASIALIAVLAIAGTLRGLGPFAPHGPNESLLLLQTFLSTVSIMALVLASIISDRERAERRLHLQHATARALAEASDLTAACPDILKAIGEGLGCEMAALWLANSKGDEAHCMELWRSRADEASSLATLIGSEKLLRKQPGGIPQNDAAPGEWLLAGRNQPLASAAADHGWAASMTIPIHLGGTPLGMLAIFARQAQPWDGELRKALEAIGIELAQFMDRQRAEDALRESELRYAQILDSVKDMILCKGPGSVITYANKAACEYYRLDRRQLLGMPRAAALDLNETSLADEERVFSTGRSVEAAEEFSRPSDGQTSVFHTIKSPIFDVRGQVVELVAVCRDITERHQSQEILRRSQERFRSLVMATAQVVWTTTAGGEVIEDLPTWRAFTGQSKEQLMGRGWMERLHPDDRERTHRLWEHSLATKTPHENRFRVRVADGTYRRVLARAVPVFAVDGTIREWVGTCTDITEKEQAENALRESEERYRTLAETSPAGIWQTTVDGFTLFINPAMCRLLELDSKEEMEGKTYRDFYTPQSIERVKQEHAKRLRGIASNYEVEIVGKRGTHRFLLICGAPLYARDGSIQSFIATLTDITPQKHALDALRVSERRFQTLSENAPDVIARFDRAHRYLYVSPAVEPAFGHSSKRFLGKTNREAGMPQDFCAQWESSIEQTFQEGAARAFEFSIPLESGLRHYHARLVPEAGQHERVDTVLAVTRDITDLKKAEAEIKRLNQDLERRVRHRTAALQETNDQLEAFCYSISHDLRAPLRAMQGFTDALVEDCADALGEAGLDYARRIATAAGRMDRLIQDLLEYSRLGRMALMLRPVKLDLSIQNVVTHLAEEIRTSRAEVVVRQPLPDLIANETVLEQVLTNLLSNALKFVTPDVPPRVIIAADERADAVRISVRDNGIGIDQSHHERIFRVFERLHGIENYPGTGIGLAIVRKGIERLGGRVGLESKVGEGSCFWIELPKRDPGTTGKFRD